MLLSRFWPQSRVVPSSLLLRYQRRILGSAWRTERHQSDCGEEAGAPNAQHQGRRAGLEPHAGRRTAKQRGERSHVASRAQRQEPLELVITDGEGQGARGTSFMSFRCHSESEQDGK